jgi:hypothetical protein
MCLSESDYLTSITSWNKEPHCGDAHFTEKQSSIKERWDSDRIPSLFLSLTWYEPASVTFLTVFLII